MRVLIFGAGAMGSVFGGFLSRITDVTLLGRNPHAKAVREHGLRVSGIWGEHLFRPDARTTLEDLGLFDTAFITTKAYDTPTAVREVLPHLTPEGTVIAMQNGIGNEEAVADVVGRDRTMGGMAIFGAKLAAPGHVEVTVYASECRVGPLAGGLERAMKLAETLSRAGIPTLPTGEIVREKWMKAFYNIALNPLSAVLRVPYGFLGEHEETRGLMKSLLKEAFAVARAQGVELQMDWEEYFRYLLERQLPPTAGHRSSMLQDLERGKRTEIDYLNGAIVGLGKRKGIKTPVNETIVRIVKALEAKV